MFKLTWHSDGIVTPRPRAEAPGRGVFDVGQDGYGSRIGPDAIGIGRVQGDGADPACRIIGIVDPVAAGIREIDEVALAGTGHRAVTIYNGFGPRGLCQGRGFG